MKVVKAAVLVTVLSSTTQPTIDRHGSIVMPNKKLISGRIAAVLGMFCLMALPVAAAPKWNCTKWEPDSEGKFEECRTCSRTICDPEGGKLTNCRVETRRECANPLPQKPKVHAPSGVVTAPAPKVEASPVKPAPSAAPKKTEPAKPVR